MNLGSFAGGAVQGYQAQQRINQGQQQLDQDADFKDRQLTMQEQQAQNQQDAIDRQTTMRQQSAALMQSSYGPQSVQDGEQNIDDGDGRTKTLPIMKTKDIQPGDDPARDQKVYMGLAQIAAQNTSLSFDDMGKIAAQVDQVRRTDKGKLIGALISGDDSALPAVVAMAGKDPTGAKVEVDPINGIYRINLADGSSLDLSRLAHAVATADTWQAMQQDSAAAQGAAKTKASMAESTATTNLRTTDAAAITAKLPGEQAVLGAHARALDANAKRTAAATSAIGDDKAAKQLVSQVKLIAPRDPNSPSGAAPDTDALSYLQGRGSHFMDSGMNARQAAAAANKEWADVSAQASKWVDGLTLSKDELKAKFGTSDKSQIKAMARNAGLNKNETATPAAPRAGNLASDDSEE